MASTFAGMSSVGSLAAPGSRVKDDKLAASSSKLSSVASISSSSLGRRENAIIRKSRSCQITAAKKELHFNKDGSAIKKLQVSHGNFWFSVEVNSSFHEQFIMDYSLVVRVV